MKGNGGVSRCGLRDCESSRDLMQRSSAGRLQARSRLERVSRGEVLAEDGMVACFGNWDCQGRGMRGVVVCDGFRKFC
jgi:hypothetical protein